MCKMVEGSAGVQTAGASDDGDLRCKMQYDAKIAVGARGKGCVLGGLRFDANAFADYDRSAPVSASSCNCDIRGG